MTPILLATALFLHLTILGRAVLGLHGLRCGHMRGWLLAPAIGLAALSLVIMGLNQAGLPVACFARPLVIGSTFGPLLWFAVACPRFPRALVAVAGLLALCLFADGWPSLRYGFDWVGYGNDDMVNYCLGAQRFLEHGFYDIPSPPDLAGGDYAQYFWMLHVAGQIRFGSEHLVAYTAGASGLKTVHVFMPVIIALAMTQLAAIVGLALPTVSRMRQALAAGALLVLLPLWHCGTMYQLIAQVGGLALLAAVLAFATRTRLPASGPGRLRLASLVAILLASLCITYPEVLPFFALGWGLCIALRAWRARRWPRGLIPVTTMAGIMVLVLLRQNTLSTLFTLLGQMQDGMKSAGVAARISLFPYFLMPAGPAFFLGFDVFVARYAEPWSSVAVAAGLIGATAVLASWVRDLGRRTIASSILAVMLLVGLKLFAAANGFGLFKLAMFALPFLAIILASGLTRSGRARWGALALLLAAPIWIVGIWRYTRAATPGPHSVVGELFDASAARGTLPPAGTAAWAETTSSPVNKLIMLEAPDAHPEFLSQVVAATIMGRAAVPFPPWVWRAIPGEATGQTAVDMVRFIETEVYHRRQALGHTFWARRATEGTPADTTPVIASSPERESFNKLATGAPTPSGGLFSFTPAGQLTNHLVFIQSEEGHHYYLGRTGQIAVYRPQPDVYSPGGRFFAIGRRLLFRVLNPSPEPLRLHFSMTATLLGAGRTSLPEGALVRDARDTDQLLGLVGTGSANLFSTPLRPCIIEGAAYLALDLGRDPIPLGLPAKGLNGLYNRELSLDTRLALGYCRDLSLVSEAEYQSRPGKRALRNFPDDLVGPAAVEYSGLYEDGWMAGEGFVVLGPVRAGETVVAIGDRPHFPGAPPFMEAELRIGKGPTLRTTLAPGPFRLALPVPADTHRIRVELRFGHTGVLLSPDDRPASVRLHSIQIEPSS